MQHEEKRNLKVNLCSFSLSECLRDSWLLQSSGADCVEGNLCMQLLWSLPTITKAHLQSQRLADLILWHNSHLPTAIYGGAQM